MKPLAESGGSAFPAAYTESITPFIAYKQGDDAPIIAHKNDPGMSLRDYFAAQALSGALAGRTVWPFGDAAQKCARKCYVLADVMLAERAK